MPEFVGRSITNNFGPQMTGKNSWSKFEEEACRIKATMLCPTDAAFRRQVEAYFRVRDIARDPRVETGLINIEGWIPLALADVNPGQNIPEKINTALGQGHAVGGLLYLFYANCDLARRTNADFQKEDSLSALKKEVGNHLEKSDAWIQKSWDSFKPVAHLWAASTVEALLANGQDEIFDTKNIFRFLAIANQIQKWATEYKPARQHRPLISEVEHCFDGFVSEQTARRLVSDTEEILRNRAFSTALLFPK